MKFLVLGLYTLFLIFVWGFFIVAKLHAYKFKNFSTLIKPITTILFVFLVFLSIVGYIVLGGSQFSSPGSVNVIDSLSKKNNSQADLEVTGKTDYENLDFNEINY